MFDAHAGFAGTAIFPGYSSDFFDQKHHVVVSAKPMLFSWWALMFNVVRIIHTARRFVCDDTKVGREEDAAEFLSAQLSVRVDVGQGCV